MESRTKNPAAPLPPVDSRLVAPEQRYEAHDGRLVYVSPADEPHGTRHSELAALLEAYKAEGYDAAVDMLTRTSETSDFAPDASIFPAARHPATGGRQLEEIAIEIVSTSGLANAGVKAHELVERGVRRVLAIDVKRARALEWSRDLGTWTLLSTDDTIRDSALAVPLPVAALVGSTGVDHAVAQALLARGSPVIDAALAEQRDVGKAEGRAEGKAEAVLTLLAGRHVEVSDEQRHLILSTRDDARLDDWLSRSASCDSVDELLGA